MSYSWRTWIAMQSSQKLGVTEAERKVVEEKKNIFCAIGDKKIKDEAGASANIDNVFEQMPEEQKSKFSKEVINDGLILLKIRKLKTIEDQQIEEEMSVRT